MEFVVIRFTELRRVTFRSIRQSSPVVFTQWQALLLLLLLLILKCQRPAAPPLEVIRWSSYRPQIVLPVARLDGLKPKRYPRGANCVRTLSSIACASAWG